MLRVLVIAAICIVGLGWCRVAAAQQQPKRVALVVGSNGDDLWGPLAGAPTDAKNIAAVLAGFGFELIGGHEIIVQNKFQFMQKMEEFVHLIGPDTVALFYYAGHGASLNGTDYLVPPGVPLPTSQHDYIENFVEVPRLVIRKMESAGGRLNIIVLDACREHPPLEPYDVATRGSRQVGRGLADDDLTGLNGTVVITSAGANQVARDDSRFADTFARVISRPGIELRSAFDEIAESVSEESRGFQRPWIHYDATVKFYFTTPANPTTWLPPSTATSAPGPSDLLALQTPQSQQAPQNRYMPLTYDHLRPLRLKVGSIEVRNNSKPQGPNDIAAVSPVTPIAALTQMAHDRLFAAGGTGKAVFNIDAASILHMNNELGGSLAVHLDILTAEGTPTSLYADARVARTMDVSEHVSDDLNGALYQVTKEMMDDMNVEFEYQVRRGLAKLVIR